MQCEVVSGFLIRHECDYESVYKCVYCKKHICERHARPAVEIEGMACTVCLSEARRADRYRDDPYFYGLYHHHHYRPYSLFDDYDDRDYRAFERSDQAGAFEGDLEGT